MRRRDHLAEVRLKAGRLAIDPVAEIAVAEQAEQFAFDVELRGFIPNERIVDLSSPQQHEEPSPCVRPSMIRAQPSKGDVT